MNAESFEYVLSGNNLITASGEDSTPISEDFQNVVYTGGPTVLLDGNEYYIQTGDGDTFVLNSNDELDDLYVNENAQSEDDTVQFIEEDNSQVVYKVGGKRLKMENGKFFTLDENGRLDQDLSILNDVSNSDGSVQYAVLKDGQLHLQISENDTVEILNNQDFVDADRHLEVQLYSENEDESLDLTNIKGRNVVTGKTLSLNEYFNKITNSSAKIETDKNKLFLNRKFTIGRKSNGKYLVGKILNIQTSNNTTDSLETNNKDENPKIQELIFDASGNILEVANGTDSILSENITDEQLRFLTKTLNGLAEMPSIHKKLIGKMLSIKLIEKRVDNDGEHEKKVNEVYGVLTPQNVEKDVKCYNFNIHAEDEFQTNPDAEVEDENSQRNNRETTSLIIITTTDSNGQKTTKVTFTDKNQQNPCAICNKDFRSQNQLTRHLAAFHTALLCAICHVQFEDIVSLTAHRKELDHYFPCNVCGKKFTSASSLKRHALTHQTPKQIKAYECSICGKRFLEEDTLLKHMTVHNETVHCCQCNKSFANTVELNLHKKSFHPPKCYYCETCGRQFARHSNLLRHEEIHGGQGNLHKCTICGCSYKFISSLTRHIVQNHVKKS